VFHVKHTSPPAARDDRGFGIYVHWPFCESKCPYCDFNSHVAARIDDDRWARAYGVALGRLAGETGGRLVQSVFLGGGTPSMMAPGTVAAVLDGIRSAWPVDDACEITMEANPGSVDAARFAGYRSAGVNRISIGVQALDDSALRRLGRKHGADDARRAIATAQRLFDRVSIDLIYARQDQDCASWADELRQAIAFGTEHLSLYQLTIEDGTVFAERHRRSQLHGLPGDDLAADLFDLTQNICSGAGLPAYEISNHARPGAECRHNLLYWTNGDFGGIGPGAHGRLSTAEGRLATLAPRDPAAWLKAVEVGQACEGTVLAPIEAAEEYLLMGLRTRRGIDLPHLDRLLGRQARRDGFDRAAAEGMLRLGPRTAQATEDGRRLLNHVLRMIVPL
jgi:oxygen-independent coproporphyrinogen-3 oxidase